MKTSDFDFELPESRIALHPANPRDSARMLVVQSPQCYDSHVSNVPDFLKAGDVLVVNNSRVLPARLYGKRGSTHIELLLLKPVDGAHVWQAFAKPAKKLKEHDIITFSEGFDAKVEKKCADGSVTLSLNTYGVSLSSLLIEYGEMPLPPYIQKARKAGVKDTGDYQTLFAKYDGSVAAPTAGLHFTEALRHAVIEKGVHIAEVTLHVGAGTFLPVKEEDVRKHTMHSEYAEITEDTAQLLNQAKAAGGRIIAVGTTSLRTLESATDTDGYIHPMARETDIFITPGYRFNAIDMLLTNFHLPKSTLFMLVCAFAGTDAMRAAYAHAIAEQYRFYSYGDACLLFRG